MRTFFTILISSFLVSLNAQTNSGETIISKNVSLKWTNEVFKSSKHNIEYCFENSKDKFICKIDGKPWFGSDQGLEMPRNQLIKLVLKMGSDLIDLDVSNMFNASFDGALSANQFLLKKEGAFYKLYGFFSDGAGTYTVHWRIINKSSVREVISNDESFFEWQNSK
jgi:hypothetical protein